MICAASLTLLLENTREDIHWSDIPVVSEHARAFWKIASLLGARGVRDGTGALKPTAGFELNSDKQKSEAICCIMQFLLQSSDTNLYHDLTLDNNLRACKPKNGTCNKRKFGDGKWPENELSRQTLKCHLKTFSSHQHVHAASLRFLAKTRYIKPLLLLGETLAKQKYYGNLKFFAWIRIQSKQFLAVNSVVKWKLTVKT